MVRLRCCLPQLQLLLLAVVVVFVSGRMVPEWSHCGILNYCLVHTGCFNPTPPGEKAGWIYFKNMGNFSHPKAPANYEKDIEGQCERYITIRPVEDSNAKKVMIRMVDQFGNSVEGLHLVLGPTTLKLSCLPNRVAISPTSLGFTFKDKTKSNIDNKMSCEFTLEANDDTDIRKKITTVAGGTFTTNSRITKKGSLSVSGKDENGTAYSSTIEDVDLTTLKILCSKDRVIRLNDPNAVDLSEFQAVPKAELLLPNPKYTPSNRVGEGEKVFEDDDRIQCPSDAPMQYKEDAGKTEAVWKLVKDGLVCRRGSLTLATDAKKIVKPSDQIKCAITKCGVCEAPTKMEGYGTNKPVIKEATEGDMCKTLKCDRPFIIIKMKDTNEIKLHRNESIACSSVQTRPTTGNLSRNWELNENNGELVEASCTTGIFCKQLNPVRTEPCESGNATCKEAQILEKYEEGRGACPAGFDVVYVAPRTGNQITLNTFKCNNVTGKWEATNNQNGKVAIVDDALIRCEKRREPEWKKETTVALGMTALELGCFGAGLFLVVVAVIVAATFYVCMVRKRKAAKKKAMESVSVTFKEPPKYKKGKHGSKRDRKERQVSVINSLTGSLSGPASQSGGGSSTPIAPPSQLLSPGKRVSKPDKGCAVLDINTGESKQMKWTNHAGDGPPTQRPTWQQSDSKQEDIQSAIKFAPGELEAARKKAQTKKKKEKSRQNSIEYNLGDPRQVKMDKSNIVNFDSSSTKN